MSGGGSVLPRASPERLGAGGGVRGSNAALPGAELRGRRAGLRQYDRAAGLPRAVPLRRGGESLASISDGASARMLAGRERDRKPSKNKYCFMPMGKRTALQRVWCGRSWTRTPLLPPVLILVMSGANFG